MTKQYGAKLKKSAKAPKQTTTLTKKPSLSAFNRDPQTSSEQLRTSREPLMKELKELGYASRMKYNGEVIVDNIEKEDVVLVKKNHQLIIHLNNKRSGKRKRSFKRVYLVLSLKNAAVFA